MIEQKTMISHITLPVFCNDTEYMLVKNSSFLYKEVISCTPFFVNIIDRYSVFFLWFTIIKDPKKPCKTENRKHGGNKEFWQERNAGM